MKNFTYLLCAVFICAVSSCQKENVNGPDVTLTGKWKVVARYISPGPPGSWIDVPDDLNHYVLFNANGVLTGNEFSEYASYAIKDSVTLTLTKSNSNEVQNYQYKISHDTLTMSPAGPIICIEGCATRFIKQD